MTGRPRQVDAIATKATLCREFNIAWADYGELTLREKRVMLEMLRPPDPEPDPPALRPVPPGMVRVT